jgi:hypothetical protein
LTTVSWVDRLLGLIKNLGRHSQTGLDRMQTVVSPVPGAPERRRVPRLPDTCRLMAPPCPQCPAPPPTHVSRGHANRGLACTEAPGSSRRGVLRPTPAGVGPYPHLPPAVVLSARACPDPPTPPSLLASRCGGLRLYKGHRPIPHARCTIAAHRAPLSAREATANEHFLPLAPSANQAP